MNLPFFAVKAYVPGGVQNQAEKIRKMPSGRYRYKNLLFQFPAFNRGAGRALFRNVAVRFFSDWKSREPRDEHLKASPCYML